MSEFKEYYKSPENLVDLVNSRQQYGQTIDPSSLVPTVPPIVTEVKHNNDKPVTSTEAYEMGSRYEPTTPKHISREALDTILELYPKLPDADPLILELARALLDADDALEFMGTYYQDGLWHANNCAMVIVGVHMGCSPWCKQARGARLPIGTGGPMMGDDMADHNDDKTVEFEQPKMQPAGVGKVVASSERPSLELEEPSNESAT